MKRVYLLLLASWLAGSMAFAQAIKLSENPDQFLTDLQKLMATGGPVAAKAQKDLESLWADNRLSQPQKERIIALSRKMNTKRYQPATHFAPFFQALYHALYTQKNVSPPDIDNLILVAEKQFDANDPKAFTRVMETARLFLERRLFYSSNYNKLYAEGGTFSFRYIEANATAPANGTVTDPLTNTGSAATRVLDDDGWGTPPSQRDTTQPKQYGNVFIPQKRALPAVTGPVLTVKEVFLAIVANGDSVIVSNTGGDLLLKDGVFVGKDGKLTWDIAGRSDISVTLADYAMVTMNPRLSADDVTLNFDKAKPIKGVLEYVSKKRVAGQAAQYPRFVSWQNNVTIPDLGPDIEYRGGLALIGVQVVGASASGQPAVLLVKHAGKPAFKASSRRFEFSDSLITGNAVQFVGYIQPADSVTHPAVQFKYSKPQKIAWLNRVDRTGYGQVPFADSYHKFYIQPEVVRWDLGRQKVDFYQVGAKREVPVRFESYDYFHPQRYSDLSVDYGYHPLQLIGNYITVKKTQSFFPEDIAQFAKVNPGTMAGTLDRMVQEGYIDREANGMMHLSRKGILYVLAYNDKKDYDNFQVQSYFNSNDSVKNATINLNDKYLVVRGVSQFTISDSLKIFGRPSDKTLKIGKNRSFTLNGQLKSGNFRYSGRDLVFDYDKFGMNLNKIDSITFTPQKLAAQGKSGEIGGDIKYEKPGMVYFATTDNKSGRMKDKKTTQRLVMPEGMTVYFNQPDRGNITYNTKVYFKIPAIDNDSIGKGDISFVGTFYSDGIFPPFKAELKTMADNTLGFVHKAPATGYPVYGSKPGPNQSNVKFTGEIKMDKSGLRSEGMLHHLTTNLTATGILFMTDSLLASGDKGEIKEGLIGKGYYPQVQLNNYSMKWFPKADSMVIMTQKNNFNFYNGTTKLDGNLLVRATGLFGNGTLRRNDSETLSESIKFNKEGFFADNAKFRIVSDAAQRNVANKPILLGSAVDVDFNQVKGIVNVAINQKKTQSIDDTLQSSMEFPYAAYKTSISRAQWNMNAKTIAMKGDVKTSTFTGTSDELEGLTFNGAAAIYDIEKMTLNISGVPHVNSADARIYPDKGLVSIRRNGEMAALKNARIELDTITLHHRMKNGNIQIVSRTRFSGDATYQFATAAGDTANIKMGSFELKESIGTPTALASASPLSAAEKAMVGDVKETKEKEKESRSKKKTTNAPARTYFTVARAEIEEKDNLMLAPRIAFKGDIVMQAPDKDLALDGSIKPVLRKRQDLVSGWIPFKEKVVERIEVKVDKNLKNEGDQPLVAGIHARADGTGLYPTFLSPKEDPKDADLFTANGVMRYDEKEKVYRIVQKGADGLEDIEGAFTFNDPKGIMTFKGKLGLITTTSETNPAAPALVSSAGAARVNVDSVKYDINALLSFAFPVPEPLNLAIADKIVKTNLDEKNDDPADDDLNELADKMIPLIGQKETEAYRLKAQNAHVPLVQASPKLNTALVLSNVNLRWSDKFKAFYSTGQLGVSHMNNTDINAQMDGFVEIRKTANGDEFSILLEASPDVWVFYDYKPSGTLSIVSSEQEINDRLLAGSKNTAKGAIEIVAGEAEEKKQFMALYLDQYKTRPKPQPKGAKVVKKDAPKEKKKEKEEKQEGF